MKYADLLPLLSVRRTIIVTGPQRSGTTIAMEMIAADLGYRAYREEAFGVQCKDQWLALVNEADGAVIQCPAMSRWAHEVPEQVAVVFMRRDLEAIRRSQDRIGWPKAERLGELQKYDETSGCIAAIKYAYWETEQRSHIRYAYELEYKSLAEHPLWIAPEQRQGFTARQTMLAKTKEEAMSQYMLCEVCHRVIKVEHGPVCCFCEKPKPKRRKVAEKVTSMVAIPDVIEEANEEEEIEPCES